VFPHEITASARLSPHSCVDALTSREPGLPHRHLAFSEGGSASPSESETTIQARWLSTSLTQTVPPWSREERSAHSRIPRPQQSWAAPRPRQPRAGTFNPLPIW